MGTYSPKISSSVEHCHDECDAHDGEREVRQPFTQCVQLLAHDDGDGEHDESHEQRADLVDVRIEETGQHERRQPEPDRPTCAQLQQEAHGCEARSPRAVEQVVQRADEPVVKAQQEGDGTARHPGHAVGQGHAEPADGVDDEFGKALHG